MTGAGHDLAPGPIGAATLDDGAILEVSHVSASYGPYRALFDVSFSIPAGGVVALVGSNGAGKSTVARTITGLVTATDGSVRFAGTGRDPDVRLARSPGSAWPTWWRAGACSPA